MLTPGDFNELADALAAANGIDRALADNYAYLIGDTPELDDQGKLIVRDTNGDVVARLIAPAERQGIRVTTISNPVSSAEKPNQAATSTSGRRLNESRE